MKENELVEQLVSAITNNDKEFSFGHQQIREALQEYGLAHIRSYAALERAGMREACARHSPIIYDADGNPCPLECSCGRWSLKSKGTWAAHITGIPDTAADEALGNFRDAATEAALPLACKAIIESLDGGEFSPASPLAKVVDAIEKVKAAARLEEGALWREHSVWEGSVEWADKRIAALTALAKETR